MLDGVGSQQRRLPVAVFGAGPVGLAAAAHLVARGLRPAVFEAGPEVGDAAGRWGHVRMFSPWSFNVDAAARALLEAEGWQMPSAGGHPTGAEIVERYLVPLSRTGPLRDAVHRNARVVAVSRVHHARQRDGERGAAPFVVHVVDGAGRVREFLACAAIDCTGTWEKPSPAGAHGVPALGEYSCAGRIAYGVPDVLGRERDAYAGATTVVVGSGHSAINVVLALSSLAKSAPGTRATWVLRKPVEELQSGVGVADTLEQRRALGQRAKSLIADEAVSTLAPFLVEAVSRPAGGGLVIAGRLAGERKWVEADRMVVATGFRPDMSFLRELRLSVDPVFEVAAGLAPIIDPRLHSCCSVPAHGETALRHAEPGFYIAGMKSYGRTPTFLLAMGYEQVRSIAAALVGDEAAARENRLAAMASSACSCAPSSSCGPSAAGSSCCGPAPAETGRVARAA